MSDVVDDKSFLINTYIDRSNLANFHGTLLWKEVGFISTIILASITIPIALKQLLELDNPYLLSIFSIAGIIFSYLGCWVLKRESTGFNNALYSISRIREEFKNDFNPSFTY